MLDSFDWRMETPADQAEFAATLAGQGSWNRLKIPHYCGPVGRAVMYYRTEFQLTKPMLEQGALSVCFKGVDYKAHVFVNGAYLGSHEGIFAPFEFEFTRHARQGMNVLVIKVTNDFPMLSNGDKVYAAVGPGWNDPESGWCHCPSGLGIYQDVSIEARRRVHFHDLFVRPLPEKGKAEAWIEVFGCDPKLEKVAIELSVFGQNFPATILSRKIITPPGVARSDGRISDGANVTVQSGPNCYKIPLTIPHPRLWQPDSPWLYQLQARLLDGKGKVLDVARRQFGMRSFRMEYVEEPKGRMTLNGKGIKLRGANTMGAFQQCVMRKDWRQLIDDILLAKITNMNYIRLTQTPVQPEIYDYCDRLGLMLQSDLPLFGVVRRNQFCEVVRQAEEMERRLRSHPSNILVSYINEPTANGYNAPYRNLTRPEMTSFFEAADMVVHMANPDRVTKAVDGDYDPPGPGLPDNHCYCGWYNGHGLDLGRLHKGYWQHVKPGWVYGCGEFGSEGLDSVELMRKYYPKHWLPQTLDEEKAWTPNRIHGAQTGRMHPCFFETQHTLADWVQQGRAHQAWATRLMTEAMRRDRRMHSFAIHLFIDAFPAGWMKAIIDCDRQPKPAWFAYREALTPLAANLRSDRRAVFADEPISVEAWICNDRNDAPSGARIAYRLECDGKVCESGSAPAVVPPLDSVYQGTLRFQPLATVERTTATVRLGLLDATGKLLHDTSLTFGVFPRNEGKLRRIYVMGSTKGKAAQLAADLGVAPVHEGPLMPGDAILIDDMARFAKAGTRVNEAVRAGARAVFLELPPGKYRIGEQEGTIVRNTGNITFCTIPRGLHFVSRATGNQLVKDFRPDDFKFWYDVQCDCPSPLLDTPPFQANGWEPILTSFDAMAAGWKADGKGHWCICQIRLAGRIAGNPVAAMFAKRLLAADATERFR